MVIENLILPPRHASHRGSALLTIHPFSNLRVFRPLTRRLDRPPLSSPTILQPSVREREREKREERREKSRCSGRREGGAAHTSQIACLACASLPGRFQGGPCSPANATRLPANTTRPRRPMRRACRCDAPADATRLPTRRACLPTRRACRPTRRACRPTRRAGQHDAPANATRLPADATRCNRKQPCLPLCQGLLCRHNAMFQTRSQGRTLHTATTVFTTEKWAVSRGSSRAVVGLVGVVAGPARSLHNFSAAQPARLALHTV